MNPESLVHRPATEPRDTTEPAGTWVDASAIELLTTTRAVRKRLDLNRSVSRELVERCLRIAFQAPNGSNTQLWGWIAVDDATTRRRMADIYRAGRTDQIRAVRATSPAISAPTVQQQALSESSQYLTDVIDRVPVLVVATINRHHGSETTFQQASKWGSILPAVWNFMLALRAHGLGSAWTTVHLHREQEMADLLGIPQSEHTQAGLFPVAYTVGRDFRPADRRASEARIFWNQWQPSA